MKPTIKMIAKKAGVSRGTIDRVLHNRPNVNSEKRQKVLDILKEMDYAPNFAARALALKVKDIKIAALLPNWTGYFKEEVLRGIEDATQELRNYNIDILLERCKTEQPQECIKKIDALIAKGIRGIAICAKDTISIQKKLFSIVQAGIPVVTFNSDISHSGRLCFVGMDLIKEGRIGAELMSKILPAKGRTLIVCGNLEFYAHKSRVQGFCDRFQELGRQPNTYTVVETNNEHETTRQRVSEYLAGKEDIKGIYMANESVAGCVEAIKQSHIAKKIPLVCHDASSSHIDFLREGIVDFVIEQNMYRQGLEPLKMIADLLIEGKRPEKDIDYSRIHIVCAENID
ncbi:MAG: LacI family DNA-binding transcriptional regulator [Dysgonamonadaceae bacterium]|jgi:LacI family transcriptional regulator|nr:LacI family DNA-binding transcriptional regulator [Dysgonamonadaceae bacterium]